MLCNTPVYLLSRKLQRNSGVLNPAPGSHLVKDFGISNIRQTQFIFENVPMS